MRRFSKAVAVLSIALAACLVATTAQAQTTQQLDVVTVGDSYASGYGAGSYDPSSGFCLRSSNSYSNKIVAQLQQAGRLSSFVDVSCAGATTDSALAQLGALQSTTDLVLVNIGGNDAGFAWLTKLCTEGECQGPVIDQFESALPAVWDKISKFLREVARRAPNAQIRLVGYGEIVAASANTPSQSIDPICGLFSATERQGLQRAQASLDLALRMGSSTAKLYGVDVSYVSPYYVAGLVRGEFLDHSLCDTGVSWYNGAQALLPPFGNGDGSVFHGNAAFHQAIAGLILPTI